MLFFIDKNVLIIYEFFYIGKFNCKFVDERKTIKKKKSFGIKLVTIIGS
jgi:hypothetical protein